MKKTILLTAAIFLLGLFTACQRSANGADETVNDVLRVPRSETSTLDKAEKNVLIVSSSPRRGGNTDLLCDQFARGAKKAGAHVEKIFLADYRIDDFTEADEQLGRDTTRTPTDTLDRPTDDAPALIRKMEQADIIVLSTPVYYMNITGQLKSLIDRCFGHERNLGNKEFFYIVACADAKEATADCAINGLRGFVVCLPNPTERGSVKAIGMGRKGGVKSSSYMEEAYRLGLRI